MNAAGTPRHDAWRRAQEWIFDPAFLTSGPEELTPLPGGLSVATRYYAGERDCALHASEHRLLDQQGQVRYAWRNLDDDGEFITLFSHANGRRYLVFRRELYGYSVLEVESGREFHFLPGESFPEEGEPARETFIWTGADYDPVSGLLAASGCYWACPNETVLLPFDDPLSEHPWTELHQALDPEYERYDDINFHRWDGQGGLHLQVFDIRRREYVPLHLTAEELGGIVRREE